MVKARRGAAAHVTCGNEYGKPCPASRSQGLLRNPWKHQCRRASDTLYQIGSIVRAVLYGGAARSGPQRQPSETPPSRTRQDSGFLPNEARQKRELFRPRQRLSIWLLLTAVWSIASRGLRRRTGVGIETTTDRYLGKQIREGYMKGKVIRSSKGERKREGLPRPSSRICRQAPNYAVGMAAPLRRTSG